MKIKICFVLSLIGYLYVGGVCIVFYFWFFVCNYGGEFVLCIEDIDFECFMLEVIEVIMDGMNWLSLEWDEGLYYQIKCFDCYNVVIDQMLEEGIVYKCYCFKECLEVLCEE